MLLEERSGPLQALLSQHYAREQRWQRMHQAHSLSNPRIDQNSFSSQSDGDLRVSLSQPTTSLVRYCLRAVQTLRDLNLPAFGLIVTELESQVTQCSGNRNSELLLSVEAKGYKMVWLWMMSRLPSLQLASLARLNVCYQPKGWIPLSHLASLLGHSQTTPLTQNCSANALLLPPTTSIKVVQQLCELIGLPMKQDANASNSSNQIFVQLRAKACKHVPVESKEWNMWLTHRIFHLFHAVRQDVAFGQLL